MKTQPHSVFILFYLCLLAPSTYAAEGWFDFDPPKDRFESSALLDLSFLNEDEAGQHGPIVARGEDFVHEATGQPVRFWGVNRGQWNSMSQKEWQEAAKTLAKRGVNLVRFHSGIFHGGNKEGMPRWEIDPQKVDSLFYAIAALKEEGIYSHLSLYFPHWMRPAKDDPKFPDFDGKTPPTMLHVIDEDFKAVYRSWWERALTERNPYTGLTLADDPAVMGLELVNEDSFFWWPFPNRLPDRYRAPLRKEFGQWAAEKYGSINAALKAWDQEKVETDNLAQGELGLLRWYQLQEGEDSLREKDTVRFLAHYQRDWAKETIDWMREDLGFGGLVVVSNWNTANPQKLEPVERWTYMDGDFTDKHAYFKSYAEGEHVAWSIRPRHIIGDRALTQFMPEDTTKETTSYDVPWIRPSWNGKPKMISETSWLRTNQYRAEAPLFYAAYGALNGTDAYTHFDFDTHKWEVKPRFFVQPWTLMSPTQMGQFPAAALIYRLNYVQEGPASVVLNLSEEAMFDLKGLPLPNDGGIDKMRAEDFAGGDVKIDTDTGLDPLLKLTGRILVNLGQDGQDRINPAALEKIDYEAKVVESINGQLKLNWGEGLMTINAPKAQGVVGFLGENDPVKLQDVMFESPIPFAAMVAVSLDNQPLATSRKILVQAMAEERPTGWETRETRNGLRQITSLGKNPWQAKELAGKVFLRGDVTKVTALDFNGYPREVIGTKNQFELLPDSIYYIVER